MTKEDIIKFIEWTDNLAYVEFIESEWQILGDEVLWELLDDNGEDREWNYCAELRGMFLLKDGFVIVNADTGCGETVTYIFEDYKEVV